jgi:hypothetical protein
MVLYGLSARTTNIPGLEYIAVRILRLVRGRPPDSGEGFIGRFSGGQRDVDLACFQQRDILGAALGVARFDRKRRIRLVQNFRKGIAVERKTAARRRRPEADCGLLNGLASILRRGAARQHHDAGANDTSDVHTRFHARLFAERQGRQIPICMKAWIWQASNLSLHR